MSDDYVDQQVLETMAEAGMITIIAGSRHLTAAADRDAVWRLLDGIHGVTPVSTLLSGLANGPDMMGVNWARAHAVPLVGYPAKWQAHGKAAGFLRNEQMAQRAQRLVVYWDGQSRGTADMIARAKAHNLEIVIALNGGAA